MASTIGVFILATTLAVGIYGYVCPDGYQQNAENEACYKYYSEPKCNRDADSACIADRGTLCSIQSAAENTYVGDFIKGKTDGKTAVWIGLHRNPLSGELYWADWSVVSYKDYTKSPFDGKNGVRCAYYQPASEATDGGSKWVAANCTNAKPFVCKASPNSRRTFNTV